LTVPSKNMLSSTHLAVLVLSCITVNAATNLTALFGPSLSPGAKIYSASTTNYSQEVTQRWTLHDAPTYVGAIKPATEADIQNIVSSSTYP
jgi:hypothetical protein